MLKALKHNEGDWVQKEKIKVIRDIPPPALQDALANADDSDCVYLWQAHSYLCSVDAISLGFKAYSEKNLPGSAFLEYNATARRAMGWVTMDVLPLSDARDAVASCRIGTKKAYAVVEILIDAEERVLNNYKTELDEALAIFKSAWKQVTMIVVLSHCRTGSMSDGLPFSKDPNVVYVYAASGGESMMSYDYYPRHMGGEAIRVNPLFGAWVTQLPFYTQNLNTVLTRCHSLYSRVYGVHQNLEVVPKNLSMGQQKLCLMLAPFPKCSKLLGLKFFPEGNPQISFV